MLFGRSDPNGLPERIAGAVKKAKSAFVIELLCGAKHRRAHLSFELSHRPPKSLTTHANRRAAAVVTDRHPLVVRHERVLGAEQLAHRSRMVDARIEVGVVFDAAGPSHFCRGFGHPHDFPWGL